jgi:hypothetical protein
MITRALLALVGLTAVCLSALAQPPDQFLLGGSLLDQPSINSPWVLLDKQDRFSFSTAFGSMRTTAPDYLPTLTPSEPSSMAYLSDNKNSVDRIYDLHRSSDIRFGGEIGFLYGKSTGSGFGREDYAGYVIGTVGNEHFSLTAGFYRQETSFSGSRWRR